MSPEEITARGIGDMPYFHWPERSTVFAERAMRLRQLASGHAMGDFLGFMADVAQAQQARLLACPPVPIPDGKALDRAARDGVPPLPAIDWPRGAAWHGLLRALVADLQPRAPAGAQAALARLASADDVFLERQADALLTGVMAGLDLACAPIVAAALQVVWTHMVLEVQKNHASLGQPFGRLDDETVCPCCGSRPTASITRTVGDSQGQRYLHCSLCGMQWHMVRIKCTHCQSIKTLAYQSLDTAQASDDEDAAEATSRRAAQAAVQAETCDDCGHYLKIVHTERDPFVDPCADDLASLTLDLLVSETGKLRHGVNLMLLFGEAEPPPASTPAPPPDPGAA
jgi:FdhE protein